MRVRIVVPAILFSAAVLTNAAAQAATYSLTATLDAAQEANVDEATPPTAAGAATLNYDDVSNVLSWSITYSGLSGAATAAHFHGPAAPVGAAAGVQVDIGASETCPLKGGGCPLVSPLNGSTTLGDAQESELLGGLWYINIHTALNPAGEIRGQVTQAFAVPALSQWAALILLPLLAGVGGWRLRRARR